MADITIDDLLSINSNQEENALVAIQQNATTFKARTRPNPTFQLNVTSQGQLETQFGVNIEIPDGEAWTIVVDADFTLAKPIKISTDSSLELYASTTETVLTYTGIGEALFQNQFFGNSIRSVSLHDIIIDGNATGILFDLVGTGTLLMEKFQVRDFDRLGETEMAFYGSDGFTVSDILAGWIIINPLAATIIESSLNQSFSLPDVTFISVMTTIPSTVTITSAFTFDFDGGSSLVFFDPNAPAGSLFTIQTSSIPVGDFYQQGTDIAATAAAAASVTETEFTIIAHDLTVGQAVVLKDFTTFPGYNGTVFVTAVNDANSVDIEIAFLGFDDTGTMNAASLDSTSVIVSARNNQGTPDSMSHAEARTGATLTVDGSGGIAVPIEDLTPAPGDWIQDINTEEFTIDTSTGLITYDGIKDRTFLITYQLTATPTSGPSQILDFDVHINGIAQTKSLTSIDTASETKTTYVGGLFVLSNTDTVQLFKENQTNTNNTDVSVATVLITTA